MDLHSDNTGFGYDFCAWIMEDLTLSCNHAIEFVGFQFNPDL
jgi:hypothetical protein